MRSLDEIRKESGTSFADLVSYCVYNDVPYAFAYVKDKNDQSKIRPFERVMEVELPVDKKHEFRIGNPDIDDQTRLYTASYRLDSHRFLEGINGLIDFQDGRIIERTSVKLVDKLGDFELRVTPRMRS